jgi:glycosyltransferase involved in cell wall biosynthesis
MNNLPISVILPVFNECKSLKTLHAQLNHVLLGLNCDYEVIYVNDGSTDDTQSILNEMVLNSNSIKVIELARNYGQTTAITAGLNKCKGEIIILMDADLQNDPADIPRLLEQIYLGFDVCSGWRINRQDSKFTKNMLSRVANKVIGCLTDLKLHDYGCTLKAYRRDFIVNLKLYGEMHRFIPLYAKMSGAKVTEIPVLHHARKFGASNYGLERVFKVLMDLLVVKFLDKHYQKPIYVFGLVGLFSLTISLFSALYAFYLKFFIEIDFIKTPLPLLSIVTGISSLMCFLMGLLAEMLTRSWHEPSGKTLYIIKDLKESKSYVEKVKIEKID